MWAPTEGIRNGHKIFSQTRTLPKTHKCPPEIAGRLQNIPFKHHAFLGETFVSF